MTFKKEQFAKKYFSLDNKIVVVTGGTGILGSLYCHRLAEAGARVVISDLRQDLCEKLASKINRNFSGRAIPLVFDLANETSVISWAKSITEEIGVVDVIVNNAATKSKNFFAPLDSFSLDDWNHVMAVNLTGMFLVIRELGTKMASAGHGSIINISSIYGVVGPDQRIYDGSWYSDVGGTINTPLVYSASKGAVISMSRYLATYWGRNGVRVNVLTPGGVLSGQNETFKTKYSNRVPMGRMANSEEMVGALLFLASDASSYITGQNIIIDGGWTAW